MRFMVFSKRTAMEILRDPLNLMFGIGFPVILLLLLTMIQKNIPVSLFEISSLTPGIVVFGLSFMTLFSASLIAKDRESALLSRLYTTSLTAMDFIIGYIFPIFPIAMMQSLICYLVAVLLGLHFSARILLAVFMTVPIALFYTAIGLLCGSVLTVKQVGGICGALFTNLSAWLSGTWFELELVGGAFPKIAYLLPFVHAVEIERAVLSGEYAQIGRHLMWVLGYGVVSLAFSVWLFTRQMRQ